MLQATAMRIDGLDSAAENCIVVCNESHRFSVADQLATVGVSGQIILEPAGRNTAPAVALAALKSGDDDFLLVMAADHIIKDIKQFHSAVKSGIVAARDGKLVTFGVPPVRAETGYGYLRATPDGNKPVVVEQFVEKPDLATAQEYLQAGCYFWNSGMFLFKATVYLEELAKHAPQILDACVASMSAKTLDGNFIRPDPDRFSACPSNSIDYAVMENSDRCAMVPLEVGWSDIGSWSALQDASERDCDGNTLDGDAIAVDCRNTYINADSRLVAAIGMDDVIIVETKDSVLVADREHSQDVKTIVEQLDEEGREESRLHREVHRPWGSYDSLEIADNFQVKRLIVKPGAELSLQRHAQRSEHWVVVRGKARITKNEDEFDLGVNESTYISIGDVHRIANPFDEPVHIIEVQCGDYLGEDDIERLEDNYGRKGTTV